MDILETTGDIIERWQTTIVGVRVRKYYMFLVIGEISMREYNFPSTSVHIIH